MTIKQSVINTFDRVGINYKELADKPGTVKVSNRFSGEQAETTPLLASCIYWVYATSLAYELGSSNVRIDDFDRVRYFVLEKDSQAYMTCLD